MTANMFRYFLLLFLWFLNKNAKKQKKNKRLITSMMRNRYFGYTIVWVYKWEFLELSHQLKLYFEGVL